MAKASTVVFVGLAAVVGLVLWRDLIAVSRTINSNNWTTTSPRPPRGVDAVGSVSDRVYNGQPMTTNRTDRAVMELEERINELTRYVERILRNATSSSSQRGAGPEKEESSYPNTAGAFNDTQTFASQEPGPLPWCDDLMKRADGIYADGNFLASFGTRVRWEIRTDGSRELQHPDVCRMRRYGAQDARRCLAGRHVSMIGDSLTRYQYLSLAHLLETGAFPARFARTRRGECRYVNETGHPACSSRDRPNVCAEGERGNWKRYNTGLGGGNDGGIMNGRLECTSHRSSWSGRGESSDNLLYRSAGSGTVLSYLSEVGRGSSPNPLHGFYFSNCTMDGSCRRTEHDNVVLANRSRGLDFDWSQPFPEAILRNGTVRSVLPRPDVALYNRGIWGSLTEKQAKSIFPAMYDWVGGNDDASIPPSATRGRCYFKSTTAYIHSVSLEQGKTERNVVRPHAYRAGCSYLDYAHLTEEFASLHPDDRRSTERGSVYWDPVHFQPWVYEELNQVLLNTLCNGEDKMGTGGGPN